MLHSPRMHCLLCGWTCQLLTSGRYNGIIRPSCMACGEYMSAKLYAPILRSTQRGELAHLLVCIKLLSCFSTLEQDYSQCWGRNRDIAHP